MLPFCLSQYPKQHQCENGNLEHKYYITCLAILDARDSLCPLLVSSPQVHQIETYGVDVGISVNGKGGESEGVNFKSTFEFFFCSGAMKPLSLHNHNRELYVRFVLSLDKVSQRCQTCGQQGRATEVVTPKGNA